MLALEYQGALTVRELLADHMLQRAALKVLEMRAEAQRRYREEAKAEHDRLAEFTERNRMRGF